ncbi:MAG: VWA domain-containing protein [Rhizomicrobium sp.]|jgi:CheY-like chemotaxis protein
MSAGRFFAGLAATLLPAVLCVSLLLSLVYFLNDRAQTGPLTCKTDRSWALPDSNLGYAVSYLGRPTAATPVPLDVILIVDESGSMAEVAKLLPQAVRRATSVLARPDNANRFALVYFSDSYRIIQPWTNDRTTIIKSAETPLAGGGTEAAAAFDAVDQLLNRAQADLGRRTAVIFFSDAEFNGARQFLDRADHLRQSAVGFYFVLTPNDHDESMAQRLTGSADHVVTLTTESDLPERLESAFAMLLSNAAGTVKLTIQMHPEIFSLDTGNVLAGDWYREGYTGLTAISPVSDAGTAFQLPLKVHEWGLWPVGVRPAQATTIDHFGRLTVSSCANRPWILVAPLWLVLLGLLPALFWTLRALRSWFRTRPASPDLAIPPAAVEPAVRSLQIPARPARIAERIVPTLVVGIGEAGVRTLREVNSELEDTPIEPRPCLIGIASRNVANGTDLGGSELVMPATSAETSRYIRPSDPGDAAASSPSWLDTRMLEGQPKDRLNVASSGSDDRALNRYAFLHWMENGLAGTLAARTGEFLDGLGGAGQILIIADTGEPFASAVILDVARQLRKASADRPVDVTLVAMNEDANRGQGIHQAFQRELDSEGLISTRSANSESSDPSLRRLPIDHVFEIVGLGDTRIHNASQTAVTLFRRAVVLLCYPASRDLRISGDETESGNELGVLRFAAAKVGFRVRDLVDAVASEIFQRWVVGSVLGAVGDANDGYQLLPPRAKGSRLIDAILKDVRLNFTDSTRSLLLVAASSPDVHDLIVAFGSGDDAQADRVRRLAINALDEIVRRVGRFGFLMSEATDVLASIERVIQSDEFEQSIIGTGGSQATIDVVRQVLEKLLADYHAQLDTVWIPKALRAAHDSWRSQEASLNGIGRLLERGLNRHVDRAFICELADELNRQLSGGQDGDQSTPWVTLRARLDGEKPIVEGRVAIVTQTATADADQYLDTLRARAEAAVAGVRQYSLGWLLSRDAGIAPRLTAELDLNPGPDGTSVILLPGSIDTGTDQYVAALADGIPPLTGSAMSNVQIKSADSQWLRRVAFAPRKIGSTRTVPTPAPGVTEAESAAERARRRIETHIAHKVPIFPAILRAAFSNKDAIRSFAGLFAAGQVKQSVDDFGRQQWVIGTSQLTFGNRSSLAEALAQYAIGGRTKLFPPSDDVSADALGAPDAAGIDDDNENHDALTRLILVSALQGLL